MKRGRHSPHVTSSLPHRSGLALLFVALVSFSGCTGLRPTGDLPPSDPSGNGGPTGVDNSIGGGGSPETATPWGYPVLAATIVPAVYLEEWRKAENRATCAPIAPAGLGAGAGATPRAATFAGGWGVAYDLPDLRSAFGVAGAGTTITGDIFSGWPNRRDWPDGSFAEYGPEGGTGPNQLAYLRVAGQTCLYNVWSRLGIGHLELLLDQLRRVTVPPA